MATELTYVIAHRNNTRLYEQMLIAKQCPVGARLSEAGTASPLTSNLKPRRY